MTESCRVAIIGGGPAGLMAAETLMPQLPRGSITVFERKPTPARKFLMAGRGGLNITHSEEIDTFITRYGDADAWLRPMIDRFTPDDLRRWCAGLGEETFVGSSGRVFPQSFKASPLLRAWQKRLEEGGVTLKTLSDWTGWNDRGELSFADGTTVQARVTLLALGGASWPRLGADGGWVNALRDRSVTVHDLKPANCGFMTTWTAFFADKFAGQPLKSIALMHKGQTIKGEAMITRTGVEGGAVYALSRSLRQSIEAEGHALLHIDLKPDMSLSGLAEKLSQPRRGESFTTFLRKTANLTPMAAALLREGDAQMAPPDRLSPADLAARIKSLPLRLTGTAGLERAISSAGGVARDELDDSLMLKKHPGIFVAGEMIDWEAPTGGYLLQATFSTARQAAKGMLDWLAKNS